MLELCEMRSTPLLPSFPGPLWPGMVVPDKGPIYGLERTKSCFFEVTVFFFFFFFLHFKLRIYTKMNCSK